MFPRLVPDFMHSAFADLSARIEGDSEAVRRRGGERRGH